MKLAWVIAAVALVFGSAGYARAGTLPGGGTPSFTVDVTSSAGGGSLSLTPTLTANPDGSFSASGEGSATSFSFVFDFSLNADPKVAGSFTLQNLSGSTQTFTVSATLGVLPLGGPTTMTGSFGDVTFTDTNDSDVTLASALFYQARIDGLGVQDLGAFNSNASGGPGVSGVISKLAFGPTAGPGVASSIGVAFPGFSLTAQDKVEVPFEFTVVVPEPAFASLFAAGCAVFLALAARRARD
jgi:hypothetical protein